MGKTKIEWATDSMNFVAGCTESGPECDNCYARTMSARLSAMPKKPERYDGVTTGHGAGAKWTGQINVDAEAMRRGFAKYTNRREPARVFLGSMTDLFHGKVPRAFLFEMLDLIAEHGRHVFMLLTKRSRRMLRVIEAWMKARERDELPDNLWCGVTAGDGSRLLDLLLIPAAVRFVSVEPMLFALDLGWCLGDETDDVYDRPFAPACAEDYQRARGLQWVIVGGESGHAARPMHPAWVRKLRDDCEASGTAYHFKQWGEWGQVESGRASVRRRICRDGLVEAVEYTGTIRQFDLFGAEGVVGRIGKHKAGRDLDGRTHDDLPAAWPPGAP